MWIKIIDSNSTELMNSGDFMPRYSMFNNKNNFMHLGKEIGIVIKPSVEECFKKKNITNAPTNDDERPEQDPNRFGDNWRAAKIIESWLKKRYFFKT